MVSDTDSVILPLGGSRSDVGDISAKSQDNGGPYISGMYNKSNELRTVFKFPTDSAKDDDSINEIKTTYAKSEYNPKDSDDSDSDSSDSDSSDSDSSDSDSSDSDSSESI
eukprot:Tbor_TRINITY_DN6107_c0_g1::TRINITY_DN6107_c0_g1_i1::g.21616::m.21616